MFFLNNLLLRSQVMGSHRLTDGEVLVVELGRTWAAVRALTVLTVLRPGRRRCAGHEVQVVQLAVWPARRGTVSDRRIYD